MLLSICRIFSGNRCRFCLCGVRGLVPFLSLRGLRTGVVFVFAGFADRCRFCLYWVCGPVSFLSLRGLRTGAPTSAWDDTRRWGHRFRKRSRNQRVGGTGSANAAATEGSGVPVPQTQPHYRNGHRFRNQASTSSHQSPHLICFFSKEATKCPHLRRVSPRAEEAGALRRLC